MDKKQELENEGFKFKAWDMTLLKAQVPSLNYEIVKDGKDIVSIIYNDKSLSIGDAFTCSTSTAPTGVDLNYKVNCITINSSDKRVVNLFESIYNNTTLFVLPLIFQDKIEAGYIYEKDKVKYGYLLNGYVDCQFQDKKNAYSVFLLAKFAPTERFKRQERYYLENKNYVRTIDVSNNYVLYEFLVPEKFRKDYDILLSGGFSKVNKSAKSSIVNFHGDDVVGMVVYDVLNKSPRLVEKFEADLGMNMEDYELYKAFDHNDVLSEDMI